MADLVPIDDQAISAGFFGEGKWLTDYVTPEELEVRNLFNKLTAHEDSLEGKIRACHKWVATQVRYVPFVHAKIIVEGKASDQSDYWQEPAMVIRTKVGNCANKAFLLGSLLRSALPYENVHVALGNLYNGKPGGHAWVEAKVNGRDYISETTRPDVPALVPAETATRYEPVHYFNDKEVFTVPGKTVLQPFANYYSVWLKDYLDWAYIQGGKRR